ncbi:MAG: PcfJ domain-containing protein, partial [Actinomycetota bacterium]|nr:PcfJ domain-containing protein [Actinomycetota bacterium]
AAAVALASLGTLRDLRLKRTWVDTEANVLRSRERAALEELARGTGVRLSIHARPEHGHRRDPVSIDGALAMMENWRGLFSPTGEPYRSLDRTLMNLPGGVPFDLVPYLSLVYLERPVLTRSELAVLTLHERRRLGRDMPGGNGGVFRDASENRIARATRLVAEHTRNPLTARRTRDLRFVVDFLMDYPGEHGGNIVGLAEKSIRWHRRQQDEEVERTLEKLGRHTPTEAPPIPVPRDPNVLFLSDVRDVCGEGVKMNNCVASYARRAAGGRCYLFHVSHAGEEATVEVDRAGRVVQAAGPGNEINAASRWGRRVLNRWGKGFPEGHEATAPTMFVEEDVYEDVPFEEVDFEGIPF